MEALEDVEVGLSGDALIGFVDMMVMVAKRGTVIVCTFGNSMKVQIGYVRKGFVGHKMTFRYTMDYQMQKNLSKSLFWLVWVIDI